MWMLLSIDLHVARDIGPRWESASHHNSASVYDVAWHVTLHVTTMGQQQCLLPW